MSNTTKYVTQDGRCPYCDSNRPRYERKSGKLQVEQSCAVSREHYTENTRTVDDFTVLLMRWKHRNEN